jgi:hypothetical protein
MGGDPSPAEPRFGSVADSRSGPALAGMDSVSDADADSEADSDPDAGSAAPPVTAPLHAVSSHNPTDQETNHQVICSVA